MKQSAILITVAVLAVGAGPAAAAGCLKGAVVGGVAGHYAHHHAILGAMAGCAVGHHMAVKKEREVKARQERIQRQQNDTSGHY